ncbi:MAG TPA: hypothetical protein VFJ58_24610 [Armatimonadota bacterium]|nr:hypothetical protein [Armatimonadota bacterium]
MFDGYEPLTTFFDRRARYQFVGTRAHQQDILNRIWVPRAVYQRLADGFDGGFKTMVAQQLDPRDEWEYARGRGAQVFFDVALFELYDARRTVGAKVAVDPDWRVKDEMVRQLFCSGSASGLSTVPAQGRLLLRLFTGDPKSTLEHATLLNRRSLDATTSRALNRCGVAPFLWSRPNNDIASGAITDITLDFHYVWHRHAIFLTGAGLTSVICPNTVRPVSELAGLQPVYPEGVTFAYLPFCCRFALSQYLPLLDGWLMRGQREESMYAEEPETRAAGKPRREKQTSREFDDELYKDPSPDEERGWDEEDDPKNWKPGIREGSVVDLLGVYRAYARQAVVFPRMIAACAQKLQVSNRALEGVVAIHELAHAVSHVGKDTDDRIWDWFGGARIGSDPYVIEGIAQHLTHRLVRADDDQFKAFSDLNAIQSNQYHAWKAFAWHSNEQFRAQLMQWRLASQS